MLVTLWAAAATAALAAPNADTADTAQCRARSGPVSLTVVELFTSEGCSSCPPADRWLSTLKGRPDVLALAFHVTYWDRLGWPDRFASPEFTARQHTLALQAGSRSVYTPQVLANGQDWRGWPRLPARDAAGAPAPLTLSREGDKVTAQVDATTSNAPARLAGYWAVLEDGHQSAVRAGENAGETLRHDHVVRLYRPVPAWAAAQGSRAQLQVSRGVPEFPRRVVFVVTDATTQRPVQALALGC
jgi:hypothetical protein